MFSLVSIKFLPMGNIPFNIQCTTCQACVQVSNLNVDHLEGLKRLSLICLRRLISKVIFHASEYLGSWQIIQTYISKYSKVFRYLLHRVSY